MSTPPRSITKSQCELSTADLTPQKLELRQTNVAVAAPPPAEDAAPPAEPPAEPPAKEPATPEPEVDPLTGLPISSTKKRVVAPKAGLFDEDEEKEV